MSIVHQSISTNVVYDQETFYSDHKNVYPEVETYSVNVNPYTYTTTSYTTDTSLDRNDDKQEKRLKRRVVIFGTLSFIIILAMCSIIIYIRLHVK